ncbi:MAG: hypothetical protein JSW34_11350 [Candidatus Zixiibacteriota bacterium]|nr:MAG: hypothetical protein JSW34_11350 [candidate division Zixibacteria bacterium]
MRSALHTTRDRGGRKLASRGVLVLSTIWLALLTAAPAAQEVSSARSVALGSAAMSLARGVDAAKFNPANLGLKEFQVRAVELVGFGANISNNSFTLGDYNKYTGAVLTDDDKADILSKVDDAGLKLTAQADASALAVAMGQFAFGVTASGMADINLSKDIIELLLNGNTFADTIEVTGSYSEGVAYASAFLSYGRCVYQAGTRELAIGATAKYLYGLGVERVVELEGLAATFATGFAGEGEMIIQTAAGGSGYALDLGAALKLNDNYTVGARIKNFLSSLTWSKDAEEHGFIFSFDTMTVENMDEDYVVTDDYTVEIDNFKTNLPSLLNVGVANTSGSLLWAIDWEQGFRRAAGASSKPRLSCGVEWSPVAAIPLRVGYSMGGNRNTTFSFGSGFHLPYFFFDYAVVTGTSISGYSSKGLNLAITTGFYF